jgi:hypothetical protein
MAWTVVKLKEKVQELESSNLRPLKPSYAVLEAADAANQADPRLLIKLTSICDAGLSVWWLIENHRN